MRSVMAESLLVNQQLVILNRSRQRSPYQFAIDNNSSAVVSQPMSFGYGEACTGASSQSQ